MDKNKTLNDKIDALNTSIIAIQTKHVEAIKEAKDANVLAISDAKTATSAEHKATIDKMVKDFDTKLTSLEIALNKKKANQNNVKLNKEELKYNKKYFKSISEKCKDKKALLEFSNSDESKEHAKNAMAKWLQSRHAETFSALLTPEETKAFNTIIDTQGGYFLIPEFSNKVNEKQFDLHEILKVIDIQSTGASQFSELADWNEYSDAEFKNQLSDVQTPATEELYQKITWNVKSLLYPKKFTRDSLEDTFLDIESYVLRKLREGMVRKKAYMVLNGTSVDQPTGLFTYASGTDRDQILQTTSSETNVITWDDVLQKLPASIGDAYLANASFVMRRASFLSLLIDTDGMGKYQIGNQVQFLGNKKAPMTIMGYPVKNESYMEAVATGGKAVYFGDFKRAYKLVEKTGQSIIKDDISDAQNVTVTLRERLDGKIVDGNALGLLVIK